MCDPVSATLLLGAVAGGLQSKRESDRTKKLEEEQERLARLPSAEERRQAAQRRSRQARAKAGAGFGFSDTVRAGGSLGLTSGTKSILGG